MKTPNYDEELNVLGLIRDAYDTLEKLAIFAPIPNELMTKIEEEIRAEVTRPASRE